MKVLAIILILLSHLLRSSLQVLFVVCIDLLLLFSELVVLFTVCFIDASNFFIMLLQLGRMRCILFVQLVKVKLVCLRFLDFHRLDCLLKSCVLGNQLLTLLRVLLRINNNLGGDLPDFDLPVLADAFALLEHEFVIGHILLQVIKHLKFVVQADQHVLDVLVFC